jgi:starch phosphorylase
MTILAMRSAGKINAVSKLHATKAKDIWSDHPMVPVTNGIHLPTWDKIGEGAIWMTHRENKRKLLALIAERTGTVWEDTDLLLGWARRMASYKRPLALVERLKQFGEMARSTDRPVRVVFAGLSHPADTDGQELLEELQYRLVSDLKGVAVYLPHYNLELSSLMTAGCDMWINTPVVGFEACGTSGMKAALNGALPMSTRDGWVAEIEMFGVGWVLPDTDLTDSMLEALGSQILPMYYDRNDQGIPEAWLKMMQNARELVKNEFSMSRALRQYLDLIATSSATSLGTR